jgi:hypothetical protein
VVDGQERHYIIDQLLVLKAVEFEGHGDDVLLYRLLFVVE